jgi:hypothetical protein|tara:strand:- start:2125 stop:2898 length:774 start_codon:yes stop_codon:yes gene_type:complete
MWPTWANIIAFDQKMELKNFAVAGMGNTGIMQRVLEADLKYNFTPDDKIMIMWASWSRNDKIINSHYETGGSIFNHHLSLKWIKDNWSMENDIIKNVSAIHYVNKLYKSNIIWQGHSAIPYTSEIDTHKESLLTSISNKADIDLITALYDRALPKIQYRALETGDKHAFGYLRDSHPDVLGHLDIVKEWIYPDIGYELQDETQQCYEELHSCIKTTLETKHIRELNSAIHVVNGILMRDFPHLMEYQDIQTLRENID